jgi:DNA transformation protein
MSHDICDQVIVQLASWGSVTAKAMFGGYGLYYQAQIFAIVVDETLYFKVDAQTQPDYEAEGSKPFIYESQGKYVSMSYWQVPLDTLDDEDILVLWAKKAYQAALRSKKIKKFKQ